MRDYPREKLRLDLRREAEEGLVIRPNSNLSPMKQRWIERILLLIGRLFTRRRW